MLPEHGGCEVAVKVQRPCVLESVALDVFVMRRGAIMMSKLPNVSEGCGYAVDAVDVACSVMDIG